MASAVRAWVGSLTVACALFGATTTRAEASSFDRWLRNPYPVADGFSFPVGDGEGGGTYTDPAGRRHDGWYVATHLGDVYPLGIHTGEDWNGRGGGDTDIGQPVMAVARARWWSRGGFRILGASSS